MARVDTTQQAILERVADRLRDRLALPDEAVYLVLEPLDPPNAPRGGKFFLGVSAGAGQFPLEEQVEGNITEEWTLGVTLYVRMALDQTDTASSRLLDQTRGLLPLKQRILAALVGWDATLESGDTFLRQILYCESASRPQLISREGSYGSDPLGLLTLDFTIAHDWSFG